MTHTINIILRLYKKIGNFLHSKNGVRPSHIGDIFKVIQENLDTRIMVLDIIKHTDIKDGHPSLSI